MDDSHSSSSDWIAKVNAARAMPLDLLLSPTPPSTSSSEQSKDGYTTAPPIDIPHLKWLTRNDKWQPGSQSSSSPGALSSSGQQNANEDSSDNYIPDQPRLRDTPSSPPAEQPPVALTPAELYRNDPRIWEALVEEMSSLKDGQWIGAHILDAWVSSTWRATKDGARFPTRLIRISQLESHINEEPTDAEILEFRQQYDDLPREGPCELENVAYIHHTGSHYFVAIFMPRERVVHVLGQYISEAATLFREDWTTWNGPNIWKAVRTFFGWGEIELQEHCTNWKQNGSDCGPTSAQVLEWIWTKGLSLLGNKWQYPKSRLPCCHGLRRSMALFVQRFVREGVVGFERSLVINRRQLTERYSPVDLDLMRAMAEEHGERCMSTIDQELRQVINSLDLVIGKCRMCAAAEDVSQRVERALLGVAQAGLTRSPLFRNEQPTPGSSRADAVDRDEDAAESIPVLFRPETPTDESIYLGNRHHTGAFVVRDWSEATLGRFPRPNPPTLPKLTSWVGLYHAQRNDYDDYVDGPTKDILDPLPASVLGLGGLSLAYIANRIMTTPWTIYKDYGYRLLPTFCQIAHLGNPIMLKEHLCPPSPFSHSPQFADAKLSRFGNPIVANDLRTVGPKEMLDISDTEGPEIMVTGRLNDGKYLRVDLEKEAQTPAKINASVDLDSIVWVTREPHFSGSIGLLMMPVIRDRPPLWKNNHIQVELLYPQSADDKEGSGPRQEWDTRKFSLSRIPHMLIATIGQVTSTVEILMFFPRMTHFHPHTHRWQNNVPPYLQKIFWDQLLYPNLKMTIPQEQQQFWAEDRDHSAFKRGGPGKMSSHAISTEVFELLMSRIAHQVSSSRNALLLANKRINLYRLSTISKATMITLDHSSL